VIVGEGEKNWKRNPKHPAFFEKKDKSGTGAPSPKSLKEGRDARRK